jgi:hypothetical protein
VAANREFEAAGLKAPQIFAFPHYAASDRAYRAAVRRFAETAACTRRGLAPLVRRPATL